MNEYSSRMTTSAERRKLKSRGQKLDTLLTIGRAGVTGTILDELRGCFERTDLVKVRVNVSDRAERTQAIETLATESGSECVGSVGRTSLLYRERSAS